MPASPSALPVVKTLPTNGFTLIELLVIVSISVILMLTVSVFFLTFIVGNSKAVYEQKLKRDGEQAIANMSQMLRNSHGLIGPCTANLTTLSFRDQDDVQITLTGNSGRVAAISAITIPSTTFYLTSDFSQLDPIDTISFNCSTTTANQTYIEINFTLRRGTSGSNDQSTLTRQFRTGVNLRNS